MYLNYKCPKIVSCFLNIMCYVIETVDNGHGMPPGEEKVLTKSTSLIFF